MALMRGNRFQFGLTLLTGLFLLAALFAILLYAVTPETPAARGPILLASFIAILIGSLLCILFLLRWLLRPYNQLLGEAERASTQSQVTKSHDEAEFVLETFQSVVAQLQEQRKELEQLSAQASERATSAEKFSERIVASLPSALIAFDGSGLSMAINAPGRALMEIDGKALGQSFQTLFENYAELKEMIEDCLQTGKLYRRTEVQVITPNGQNRRLGATIAPIELPPERGPSGALCLLTDITEVTELREQVALKKNLESLGEMSAGLAHEFKNAMAALHGYAQFLQTIDHDQQGQTAADALLQEVRNLSEMTTSFLNFARPQPLQLEEVDLAELIQECASELTPLFNDRSVEILVGGSADVPSPNRGTNAAQRGSSPTVREGSLTKPVEIQVDTRMLRQALLNLLRNAAEAIPNHQTNRRVTVRTATETDQGKRWATISIKDTGAGIAAADLQKIFIPFFTTKTQGHGIGLALAHRVITEHGGTLTVGNAPEGGAVLTIRLPQHRN